MVCLARGLVPGATWRRAGGGAAGQVGVGRGACGVRGEAGGRAGGPFAFAPLLGLAWCVAAGWPLPVSTGCRRPARRAAAPPPAGASGAHPRPCVAPAAVRLLEPQRCSTMSSVREPNPEMCGGLPRRRNRVANDLLVGLTAALCFLERCEGQTPPGPHRTAPHPMAASARRAPLSARCSSRAGAKAPRRAAAAPCRAAPACADFPQVRTGRPPRPPPRTGATRPSRGNPAHTSCVRQRLRGQLGRAGRSQLNSTSTERPRPCGRRTSRQWGKCRGVRRRSRRDLTRAWWAPRPRIIGVRVVRTERARARRGATRAPAAARAEQCQAVPGSAGLCSARG